MIILNITLLYMSHTEHARTGMAAMESRTSRGKFDAEKRTAISLDWESGEAPWISSAILQIRTV